MLSVAKGASDSARDQLLKIVETQLETYPARVQERVEAKRDAAGNAFDEYREEIKTHEVAFEPRSAAQKMLEAAETSGLPLRKEFFAEQTERTLKKAIGDEIEAAIGQDSAIRFLKWAAARIGLDLKVALPPWSEFDWDGFGDLIREAVITAYDARTERHLAEISTLLDERLRGLDDVSHDALGRLLLDMALGQSVTFNKKTHRRETRLNQRFPYVYYAAQLVARQDRKRDDLLKDVLAHLRQAQTEQQLYWGETELTRLSTARAAELDAETQAGLRRALGDAEFEAVASQSLGSLNGTQGLRDRVRAELGRQLAHGLHRQLMLGVSGQLWVDYLTTIEGLRTSISLEAYAQRDPLTAYKSKAFDLFQQLLVDMRAGVVGRLFTYRPRKLTELRAEVERAPSAAKKAPGRNEPCWCGSGKKYKNCHMAADGGK